MTGASPDVVIFDLFGVLVGFDNRIVYSRLAPFCAEPASAVERLEGLMAERDVITGRRTLPEIHQRLVEVQGLALPYPAFETAWLTPYSWAMPGMAKLVERLSSRCRLLLLSNVDGYYWTVVRAAHPELEHFHSLLVSCDLGVAKPDPEIFQHASRVADGEPSRCLFVDDSRVNVDAAGALGFQTHWFRDVPGLLQDLQSRGIA